jgi:tRNA pseudouridine38-40 synthase
MERYQVILSYDGTEFHGFQRQGSERTVQLEVENALRRMGWKERSILAAGRTDAGVHANGQVIAFDLQWSHDTETLARAMNAHLPEDIGIRSVKIVDPAFHPRFDAVWRTYRYQVYFYPFRDPLRDRFAWRLWPKSGRVFPQEAATQFVGKHDFQAFGTPMKPGGNTVRTVRESFWIEERDSWTYQITANAFLKHMVRRVVHAQILATIKKMSHGQLEDCISKGLDTPPGLAPPNGLTLHKVVYEDRATKIEEGEFAG